MGISLLDCIIDTDNDREQKIYQKITTKRRSGGSWDEIAGSSSIVQ